MLKQPGARDGSDVGETAMRLAISVERQEGNRLVGAYNRMALRELLAE